MAEKKKRRSFCRKAIHATLDSLPYEQVIPLPPFSPFLISLLFHATAFCKEMMNKNGKDENDYHVLSHSLVFGRIIEEAQLLFYNSLMIEEKVAETDEREKEEREKEEREKEEREKEERETISIGTSPFIDHSSQ
ncbi:hypothetical protein VIGAN_05123700 [Vigna angularis var. angularis]|uniref:Uncharacterized protein n=1 Tax=Vigna angularis var. angularis TaxID=157739 RepID=A0A0S3S4U5_PHAAN|nr:hypothetical protein VIGAN_05123700 [Vigna angularis var. angularis]